MKSKSDAASPKFEGENSNKKIRIRGGMQISNLRSQISNLNYSSLTKTHHLPGVSFGEAVYHITDKIIIVVWG